MEWFHLLSKAPRDEPALDVPSDHIASFPVAYPIHFRLEAASHGHVRLSAIDADGHLYGLGDLELP